MSTSGRRARTTSGRRGPRLGRSLLVALPLLALLGYGVAWATTARYGASRAVAWLEADTGDIHRFPARVVAAGGEPVELPVGTPLDLGAAWSLEDPDRFLAETQTSSLLVLQDGVIRHEQYLRGGANELRTSFSSVKSIVSTLIGLAIEDGSIASVDEPITSYVPELLERDRRFAEITVRDLLTMSSGLRYVERSLPWSDDAQTYYGTDLRATALSVRIEEPPGRTFLYNNYNLLLEGLILERATGERVSDYLSSHLWQPMGAEADASWSLDSVGSGFEKMESGFNATTRDYARFGLLFANDGRAAGRQVVPESWIDLATSRALETWPNSGYGFHWWTGRFDDWRLPEGHFMAAGNLGQFVYVAPDEDVVVVRLGDDYGTDDWPERFVQIVEHLEASPLAS